MNVQSVIAKLGSFWSEGLNKQSKQKLNLLVRSALTSRLETEIEQARGRMIDNTDKQDCKHQTFTPDWYSGELNGRPYFTTPSPVELPLRFIQADKTFELGVDFALSGGLLYFKALPEYPTLVIESALVRCGQQKQHTTLYGLHLSSPIGQSSDIANYLRGDHTPSGLERALRAQLGLVYSEKGGTVIQRTLNIDECTYITEHESLRIPYKHNYLEVGDVIPPRSWVGQECVTVRYKNTPDWYKVNDWTNGIRTEDVTSFSGGVFSNLPQLLTIKLSAGGVYGFSASTDSQTDLAFWAGTNQSGYPSLDQFYDTAELYSPIDILFQNFLPHGLIITIDAQVVKPFAVHALMKWAASNMLLGYLPIYRVLPIGGSEMSYADYTDAVPADDDNLLPIGAALVYGINDLIYSEFNLTYF